MIILPSLEIVPAKYSGSTLLSQIPIDGTGDFTVSRTTSPVTGLSTRVNSLGQIETVADNTPRLDYLQPDGTVGCPALLVEPAATNGIRNNSMVGAVTGTPGTLPTGGGWSTALRGLTQTIVGTGTENGIAYIDIRFSGTATSTNTVEIRYESDTQIVASSGQVWTHSVYLKKIAEPSPPNNYQLGIYERTSGGVFVSFGALAIVPTTTIQRFTQTRTLSGVTTARVQPALFFAVTSGSPYDFTIRVGYPQMELGSVATSVIPTTTQAIARGAEVISRTSASALIGQTEGTIYAEAFIPKISSIFVVGISNGLLTSEAVYLQIQPNSSLELLIRSGGSIVSINIAAANWTAGLNKVAFTYGSGSCSLVLNGGLPVTGTVTNVPTCNRITLGSRTDNPGTQSLTDRIRAAALYPNRLTNTQLALLTSPYTSYSSMASALSYTLG